MVSKIIKSVLNKLSWKTDDRLVLLLSDDWGSVRIRSTKDQSALGKKGLKLENRFDRYDALETNDDLELLFETLTKYKDHKGKHPVLTAVCNVANPDFKKIEDSGFSKYSYESIAETYSRYPKSESVLPLMREGIRNGIFFPQSHGREHLQVNWWLEELKHENSFAREVFEQEFFFLGATYLKSPKRGRGIGAAFDVWDESDLTEQKEILDSGLTLFKDLFGYASTTFTPPAMYYHPSLEKMMVQKGVKWLDVGRFLKTPKVGGGESWQINYLGRRKKSGLRVLVRNAMFETNISDHDNGVARCLHDIERAFSAKQPAIISNHRASFVGRIDPKNREKGLKALDELLGKILKTWPDVAFISPHDLATLINK